MNTWISVCGHETCSYFRSCYHSFCTDHPLANGFMITNGRAAITVPSVTTRNSYILVLFGDSANPSARSTIQNISIANMSSSPTSNPASSGTPSSTSAPSIEGASPSTNQGSPTSSGSPSVSPTTGSKNWAMRTGTGYGTVTNVFIVPTLYAPTSGPDTYPAYASTGVRIASLGGPAVWISAMCSLAMVLGTAVIRL